MTNAKTRNRAGTLIGLGLALAVLSLIFLGLFETPAVVGLVAGGILTISGLLLIGGEVLRWLAVYWVVVLFWVTIAVAVLLPEAWLAAIPGISRLPDWVGRFALVLLVQLATLTIWLKLRDETSFLAKRAAVAANVTILIEVALALLIVVNLLGTGSLTRWMGSYDATAMKVYSLGDRTRNLLDSLGDLPAPVHAVYVEFGTTYQSFRGEQALGTRGKDFLRQYGDYTPNVIVKEFDGVRDTTEAEDYFRELGVTDLDLSGQDTVVFLYREPGADEPNRKDVKVDSGTFLGKSQLGTPQFKGEQYFTSAIQDVMLPKKKVYVLEGHDEHPLYGSDRDSLSGASERIRKLSVTVESLNLSERGAVPDDADLLLVAGPKKPFLAAERDEITKWLDRGGSMILLLDPQKDLFSPGADRWETGLEDYLTGLGIDPKTDYLSMDYELATGRTQAVPLLTPQITTADYSFHAIVKPLRDRGFPCIFPYAAPVLVEKPEGAKDLTTEELVYVRRSPPGVPDLLTYAAKVYPGRDPRRQRPGDDITDKHIPIGAVAERKLGDGEDGKEKKSTRVIVIGNSDFVTKTGLDTRSPDYAPGNATLLTNSVSWAVGREQLLSIEPKTLETERVTLTEKEKKLAYRVALFALPVLVLFFAIGAAWRRRR